MALHPIQKVITVDPTHETSNPRDASYHVTTLLTLRAAVRAIPAIRHALDGASSDLLRTIASLLNDRRLEIIEGLLAESLNDDVGVGKVCTTFIPYHPLSDLMRTCTTPQKRSGLAAINNKVYAVKANYNRMLDVARETYKENVSDIHELAQTLSSEHDLPLSITYVERGGGFWFNVPKNEVGGEGGGGELPRGFLNVSSKGAKFVFTSLELVR